MAGEPALKEGDTGEWVTYLHHMLAYHGHATSTTEVYDQGTAHSVRRLQQQHHLAQTGEMDEKTWSALLGDAQPEEFRLVFAERPVVHDGNLVWTLRNDGPGRASQFVEHASFVDLDSGQEVGSIEVTRTSEIEVRHTVDSFPVTAEEMSYCLHEGKRYRVDLTTHLYGNGDQASLEFTVEGGRFAAS